MNRLNIDWRIRRFARLPSTSDVALAAIKQGAATTGDVYLAERQTAGRGRQGRRWVAGPGALLVSAVLPVRRPPDGASLAAGIAVAEVLSDLGIRAGLKWPNDILLSGRKLGGILVELRGDLAVVGIGLNVNNPCRDTGEAPNATSLAEARNDPVDREALFLALLTGLDRVWATWTAHGFGPLRSRWNALDLTRGRPVRVGDRLEGIASGVDESAALLVRLPDGECRIARVGEVTFLEDGANGE